MQGGNLPRYATFRDYLRVLRANRVLILLMMLVFGAAGWGLAAIQEPVYSSQASIAFSSSPAEASLLGGDEAEGIQAPEGAQLVAQPHVLRAAARELGLEASVDELEEAVSGSVETTTFQVIVEVLWSDAEASAALANAVAGEVVDRITRTERRRFAEAAEQLGEELAALDNPESATGALTRQQQARLQALSRFARPAVVSEPAEPPEAPISPSPVRNTVLGLILGLTLGVGVAFARDSLDRRLRGSREMEEHLGLPLLGQVQQDLLGRALFSRNGGRPLALEELESFQILRSNLELSYRDQPPRVFAVASGLPEEGKTTVATGLAIASVIAGRRSILVECDLRRPALAARTGLEASPGVSDYVAENADREQIVQSIPIPPPAGAGANGASREAAEPPELDCITAGSRSGNPVEVLRSKRFQYLLFDLIDAYEVVVLDTSPILAVADTRELVPLVDLVLLCVRSSQTTREQAKAAEQAAGALATVPTALVATGLSARDESYYGYYSYAQPS